MKTMAMSVVIDSSVKNFTRMGEKTISSESILVVGMGWPLIFEKTIES